MTERQITGKHVFWGFTAAFGVIIAVNLVLAFSAVKTFPGLEVKNGYIASQTFNARKAAQEALGWTVSAHHADGLLTLAIRDAGGTPVQAGKLEATVGRATQVSDDVAPDFQFNGNAYVARVPLGGGKWDVRMTATALDGTTFQQRLVLVKE